MKLVLRAKEMMGDLPPYWHENEEMQLILNAQSIPLDKLHQEALIILQDAYLSTMSESRISEWEKWLKLEPIGTVEERRTRILRYFGVIVKLNEESIKTLVARFCNNANARVKFKDGEIKIIVIPLPENFMDELDFSILEAEIAIRKPQHLGVNIERYIATWGEIAEDFDTWGSLKTYQNWNEILMYISEW